MPPVVNIPAGCFVLDTIFDLAGDPEPMRVSAAYRVDTDPTDDTWDAFALARAQAWLEVMVADYSSGRYTIRGNPGTQENVRRDGVLGAVQTGQAEGSGLPQNCAGLVKKVTGLGGRGNVGRSFIPGLPEGEVSVTGALTADLRNAMTVAAAGLVTVAITEPPDPLTTFHGVLLHSFTAPDPAPAETDLIAAVPDNRIATQRRRLR